MLSKPAGKIQFYVATGGQTDGHITTAKPALMHGVYGGKTIMIQEMIWVLVHDAACRYNALT